MDCFMDTLERRLYQPRRLSERTGAMPSTLCYLRNYRILLTSFKHIQEQLNNIY